MRARGYIERQIQEERRKQRKEYDQDSGRWISSGLVRERSNAHHFPGGCQSEQVPQRPNPRMEWDLKTLGPKNGRHETRNNNNSVNNNIIYYISK